MRTFGFCKSKLRSSSMFSFLCRMRFRKSFGDFSFSQLETSPFICRAFSSSSIEVSSQREEDLQQSFTVSYLINYCGLPLESALSASKHVHFETPDKPDSVLVLLRNYGFTHEHIPKLVNVYPRLLLANPKDTLLPKIQFFSKKGFSTPVIVRIFHTSPRLFTRSIPNHLIPCYDFLKSIGIADEKVATALKCWTRLGGSSWVPLAVSNIAVLRKIGIPEPFISYLVIFYCPVLLRDRVEFNRRVGQLIEMGFNPKRSRFIHGLHVVTSMPDSTMEHKMEIFKRWGLSQDEIQMAFRKFPLCYRFSERKLMDVMDFLVNKMGWQPAAIARIPVIFSYNLEKRLVPRCSVFKVLQLKGLVRKDVVSERMMSISEERFLSEFVTKYQEHVPQLMDVFRGKLDCKQL